MKIALSQRRFLLVLGVTYSSPLFAGQFYPGNLAVSMIGGSSNASTAAYIEQFNKTTTNQSVNAASQIVAWSTSTTSTGSPLTDSGSAGSDGRLTRSADGYSLVETGYASPTGVSNISSTPAVGDGAVPRVVGVANALGQQNTTTGLNAYDANNIREVASTDGTNFWTAGNSSGSTDGIRYSQLGAPLQQGGANSVQVVANPGNTNGVGIFDGQLYESARGKSGTYIPGIYEAGTTSGTPLPTSQALVGNQTLIVDASAHTANPSTGPYDFFMDHTGADHGAPFTRADGTPTNIDTAYLTDTTTGISRYHFNGSSWVFDYTFSSTSTGILSSGVTGLTGEVIGGITHLYGISGDGTTLFSITDTGAGASISVLATAPAGDVFRGVALTPYLPGDANGDGTVSPADYAVFASNYNKTDVGGVAGIGVGDFNEDGKVTPADYAIFAAHYGQGQLAGLGASVAIPEPASCTALGIGGAALLLAAIGRRRLR